MKGQFTTLLFLLFITCANAQQFHDDGRLKLTGFSSDPKYGLTGDVKFAIKAGDLEKQYAFMYNLTGPNGEELTYQRLDICCAYKDKKTKKTLRLDKWEVSYEGLPEPIYLYFNRYEFNKPLVPVGFGIIP
jgi:hypothetical protein